jgi:multidrug efflux pump subunit AcrB
MDKAVEIIKSHEEVTSAAIFTGGTRRAFTTTSNQRAGQLPRADSHQHAHEHDVKPLLVKLRRELDESVPGARCVAKELEQGPPVKEPIQIRLSGENLDKLRLLADQTAAELRAAGGYHVHDDLGLRMPNIQIEIDQDRANSLGLNNRRIGEVAQASFTGLKVTELREGDRLIPVLIRGRIETAAKSKKSAAFTCKPRMAKAFPSRVSQRSRCNRSSSRFPTTTSFAP